LRPERFATAEEVYPPGQAYQITPEVPADSYKKAVFNAPYADVFRAVEVAATQAGQNIESSDKSKGLILTTRDDIQGQMYGHQPRARHLIYAITVRELQSRTTEVAVFSKVQLRCVYHGAGEVSLMSCLTLGLLIPFFYSENSNCTAMSTPHWPRGNAADIQGLSQLINFTRNNLIAAGAL
jgi:hypothetical protein